MAMTAELQTAWSAINDLCPNDPLLAAKMRALLPAYHQRWHRQSFTVLEVEQTITADLYNPETQARSRSFDVAGKKDVLLEENSKLWLMDHKTTSDDIFDPASPYWKQLVIEAQHLHYCLLEHLDGRRVEGAIWDVMRKPAIAPRQISKADQGHVLRTHTYFGGEVTPEDIAEMRATGRESFHLYELRLYHDATRERPEWYFQRRRVARIDHELIEYATELWDYSQNILAARRNNRWPRNSQSCMNFGHPCTFLGICSHYDTETSDKWRRKKWVHNELPIMDNSDGKQWLTNSRLGCFKACNRKHYLSYELGIERVEEEETDSLVFGNAWHRVMAEYFNQYREEHTRGNTSNGEPAIAVGCAS